MGGNGDDTFYPGYNPENNSDVKFVGQGGKDNFNLDFFGDNGRLRANYMVWGDWGYGPEDDPYNVDLQYGDPSLEPLLQDDDDTMYIYRYVNEA